MPPVQVLREAAQAGQKLPQPGLHRALVMVEGLADRFGRRGQRRRG